MAAEIQKQYLSLNEKVSPALDALVAPSAAEIEEMRHKDPPLRYAWTVWEQVKALQAAKSQYSDATRQSVTFSTVKGFWMYWNHIPQPSELVEGKKFVSGAGEAQRDVDALMLFKAGIRPEWEDSVNASGGHFQFQLKPSFGGGAIDEYWNNIILGMVGGTIEPPEMITGARLVNKLSTAQPRGAGASAIRIEVWFSNFSDTLRVDQLQRSLEACMTTQLDGTQSKVGAWGKTERKSH